MIWFLRIFSVFFFVLTVAAYSQNERSLTQSTTTDLKFEPAIRVILQTYGAKSFRLPVSGDVLEGKLEGEVITITITEVINQTKMSLEILGLQHTEKEVIHISFADKENRVQIVTTISQKSKTDPLSRLVFLFFGKNSLKSQSESMTNLLQTSQ